jgi:hypothetical protein
MVTDTGEDPAKALGRLAGSTSGHSRVEANSEVFSETLGAPRKGSPMISNNQKQSKNPRNTISEDATPLNGEHHHRSYSLPSESNYGRPVTQTAPAKRKKNCHTADAALPSSEHHRPDALPAESNHGQPVTQTAPAKRKKNCHTADAALPRCEHRDFSSPVTGPNLRSICMFLVLATCVPVFCVFFRLWQVQDNIILSYALVALGLISTHCGCGSITKLIHSFVRPMKGNKDPRYNFERLF